MQESLDFDLVDSTHRGLDHFKQGNGTVHLEEYNFKDFCIKLIF